MKNVLSKVLMMFVMSFMLFTCSYAELNIGDTFECKQNYNILKISTVGDYTQSQMRTILENYKNYPSTESYQVAFNNLITVFSDLGCNNYFFIGSRSSTSYFFVAYPDNCNLYFNYSDGHQRIYLDSVVDSIFYCINNNSSSQKNTVVSNGIDRIGELYLQSFDCYYSTTKSIKFVEVDNKTIYFNGDYYYQASVTPDTPSFSDDELASIINTFINSEDFLSNRPSGYDDFFITYNTISEQYYAYLYKSSLDLAMIYGGFDENGKFEPSGLSNGEGYNIFWYTRDNNFLQELWNNLQWIFHPAEYLYFRINPTINNVHYIATYKDSTMFSDSQMLFTTSEENIVYSTKDINLIVNNGGSISTDETNSYKKDILINSTTNEEYKFNLPSISVSETPWSRFINVITFIPSKIADAIGNKMGFNKVMFIVSPLFETIYEILGVFLACLAFIGRAITFVYTLPTIEASSALFNVDVAASSKGLFFSGNNWGSHFLSGLDKLKAYSWNGITLWSFFEAFVVALVAVIAIKLVRKHYHM